MNHSFVKILIISKIVKDTRTKNEESRKIDVVFFIWAALSAFRSQSFLPTISLLIELEYKQKRISTQVGLQLRKVQDLSINPTFPVQFKSAKSPNLQEILNLS